MFIKLLLTPSPLYVGGQSLTEEAFDKNARGAMHTKREGKAL